MDLSLLRDLVPQADITGLGDFKGTATGCLPTSEEIENADFDTMERMVENFVFNLRAKAEDVYTDLEELAEEDKEEE